MKIRLAGYAGFCSGVTTAVEMVLAESGRGAKVSTLGPLVHNEAVMQRLQESGIEVVEKPEAAVGGVLVIRTHGVAPAIFERCRELSGLKLRDATCLRVRRAQRLTEELSANQVQVVIYGDPRHPEVAGLVGWSGGRAKTVTSVEELNRIDVYNRSALLAQTTADRIAFNQIASAFLTRFHGGQVYDTICPETELRQKEAAKLARTADVVVVVGSKSSANTAVMVEICSRLKPTCRVADAGELDSKFLNGCRNVLVTAGASTPHWMIKEVVESMEKEGFVAESEGNFDEGTDFQAVQAGEQVVGKVVRVTPEEVYLDIGSKTEALLPRNEVFLSEGETLPGLFNAGEAIEVTVLKVDEQDQTIVSYKRLAKEKRWRELEKAATENQVEEGRVKQVVPAGMVIELGAGIEGFMPGSMVDLRFIPDFKHFSGEKIQFKVIEYNREKDKVILSRKKLLEEESARNKESIINSLKVGSIIPGVVRRIADFGAFVDVGGIDGLIHISELAWERVVHTKDLLKVGDKVEVKVLKVIPEHERVSLSLRQAQADPWSKAAGEWKAGQVLKGRITRLANFGAFIELKQGVEGLVHISQIADYHIKHPSEVLREGEEVAVKILEIKAGSKRISLSVKDAGFMEQIQDINAGKSADNGNVTLGDVFGNLFDQEKDDRNPVETAQAEKEDAAGTGKDDGDQS
ncbi:MAG: bifunctional 4-hydroxy-3-methylbut-2-enyl diphosphate reductase/30S ribosomal protein S1 [Dethiobacter sp.]|nr:bifunctional 4-hydroxy-3-methylbut-2-enyl diphosphate reductase/30S ribosomal protein S1 [Dethiobacter sp.]